MFALGLALSAFDAAATWLWLRLGIAAEANPLLDGIIDARGATIAMALRALLGLAWFAGFAWLSGRTRLAEVGQRLALALLAVVAGYHLAFGMAHARAILQA